MSSLIQTTDSSFNGFDEVAGRIVTRDGVIEKQVKVDCAHFKRLARVASGGRTLRTAGEGAVRLGGEAGGGTVTPAPRTLWAGVGMLRTLRQRQIS